MRLWPRAPAVQSLCALRSPVVSRKDAARAMGPKGLPFEHLRGRPTVWHLRGNEEVVTGQPQASEPLQQEKPGGIRVFPFDQSCLAPNARVVPAYSFVFLSTAYYA